MPIGKRLSDPRVWKGWYKTKRWQKLSKEILKKYPMCQCPHCKGKRLESNVTDHIIPHKGDTRLFWDKTNLQAMNKECHDRFKQSEEKGGRGFNQGCDIHGNPLNELDHWK